MKRMPKDSVGKYVRVVWDDAGAQDGIVVSVDDKQLDFKFFPLFGTETQTVRPEQVLKIGAHITAVGSGLD